MHPATATIIGGGPAGLIAAEVIAQAGFQVCLYEQMPSVGRKILLAGRSGLNLTHSEPLEQMLGKFGAGGNELERALRNFGPAELRAWCADLGQTTFVGSSGRVFPTSLRATPLLRAWLVRLADLGVIIRPRHRWEGWGTHPTGAVDPRICRFRQPDGAIIDVRSDVVVMALGGASWPRVGSDGAWVKFFAHANISVHRLRPANCGVHIAWTRTFVERFAGQAIKNTALTVESTTVRGDISVTKTGLESGPIYNHSAATRNALDRDGFCTIYVDLHPDLSIVALHDRLARRRPKESVSSSLQRLLGLTPVAISLLREATTNDIPNDSRTLAELVKAVPLTVTSTASIDRAISTAGGVAFGELNESFMLRRLPGVFVAGEMLDWEAPTGGYLLQGCFSTGVAAATGAVNWLTPTQSASDL